MDFETYTRANTGVQIPYAWGFKMGCIEKVIINFDNPYSAIAKTLYEIAKIIDKKVVIYIHNLSKFDSYFIIKAALTADLPIDVIKSDKGFMALVVKIEDKEIHFHDSFLLLPSSLRKLSNSFEVNTPKGYFPHSFVTPENAEYVGYKPTIEHYPNISNEEYDKLPTWFNMNQEIHEYLSADILSLYEVLDKFMH